jgi:LasA protease
MATVEPTPPPQVYIVQSGDTLGGIAARFGCQVDAIIRANKIANPNVLSVGQQLEIPSPQIETGPADQLLPDSEFVNGPAYVDFDIAAFVADQGGYLANYSENVGGEVLSGAEIVRLVAHHYSVGPRLLLAIIELKGGWVTGCGGAGRQRQPVKPVQPAVGLGGRSAQQGLL